MNEYFKTAPYRYEDVAEAAIILRHAADRIADTEALSHDASRFEAEFAAVASRQDEKSVESIRFVPANHPHAAVYDRLEYAEDNGDLVLAATAVGFVDHSIWMLRGKTGLPEALNDRTLSMSSVGGMLKMGLGHPTACGLFGRFRDLPVPHMFDPAAKQTAEDFATLGEQIEDAVTPDVMASYWRRLANRCDATAKGQIRHLLDRAKPPHQDTLAAECAMMSVMLDSLGSAFVQNQDPHARNLCNMAALVVDDLEADRPQNHARQDALPQRTPKRRGRGGMRR